MDLGVDDLEARLAEYLARTAAGETFVIIEHGHPIAHLTPPISDTWVDRSLDEGWLLAPRRRALSQVARVNASRSTLSALREDRG
jgi:antitoxin (DNA-binding transcriptional repressor) of toxin-antitoxin stability system